MTAEVSARSAPAATSWRDVIRWRVTPRASAKLTALGHAHLKPSPPITHATAAVMRKSKSSRNEHEQRDADDDTDQKARGCRTASRRAAPELERHEVSASPRACLPPSIGRRRRRPHSPPDPDCSSSGTPPPLWPRSGCPAVRPTSAPHTATKQAEDLDEDHSKERRSILRSGSSYDDQRAGTDGNYARVVMASTRRQTAARLVFCAFASVLGCAGCGILGAAPATTTQVPSPAQRLIPVERARGNQGGSGCGGQAAYCRGQSCSKF